MHGGWKEGELRYETFPRTVPGVMQLESNLASVGSVSPFSSAFFILSSASFADLKC